MMIRSSWRAVVLLVFIGVCVVIALTVGLLVSGGSDDSRNDVVAASLRQRLSVDTDPLVVTQVRVVEADTDDAARNNCSTTAEESSSGTAQWIIAGKNLNATTTTAKITPTGKTAFTYLCMRQARVRDVQTNTTNGSVVLQSLRVVSRTSCPPPLVMVYRPRPDAVICSQTINATVGIATGMYVSDLTVTTVKPSANAVPGWTTPDANIAFVPTAIASASAPTDPLFVSYRRPVRPIVSTRVLQNVGANDAVAACTTQLGERWEQAGDSAIEALAPNTSIQVQTIVCIERASLNATDAAYLNRALPTILVEVALVPTTGNDSDDCGERQALTSDYALCTKFANSTSTVSFIGELRLLERRADARHASMPSKREANAIAVRMQSIGPSGAQKATLEVLYQKHTGILVNEALVGDAAVTTSASSPTTTPLRARPAALPSRARQLRGEANATATPGLAFKIVQLADLHYTGDASHECRNPPQEMVDSGTICTEADTTAFVEKVLDAEKPDFVVFSGDNVEVLKGGSMSDAIKAMLGPAEARKIPYAVVFGNHDDENGQSRANMAQQIIGREFSHMQWGPTSVAGVGNYELSVNAPSDGPWGPAGSKVFQMYFLDSHGYLNATAYPNVKSTYDWIKPDQVAYYKEMALANRNASKTSGNGSSPLPAVMFFHIPIPEYASVGSPKFRSGDKNENAASSEVQSNLFSALVEMGDVKATFVGHDHLNEYCFKRQDVQLCYGGGTGFAQAYGSAQYARRSRVIEWSVDAQNTRRIKSWKRHYGSAFDTRQHEEVLFESL